MAQHYKSALSSNALKKLKRSILKFAFEQSADAVLRTSPLRARGVSPLYLTLLCHRDLTIYLIAIKSLYSQIGHGRVAIINDGSLTAQDLVILRHHVHDIEVYDIAAVNRAGCPRGGCWERLIKIVELAADDYVIQLDADTLAIAPVPEVVQSWSDNRSFLLGTGSGRQISAASTVACMVRGWIKQFGWTELSVGVEAEASLDRLPDAAHRLYVHASAGFAGFARGAVSIDHLAQFSSNMSELLGAKRWEEWGSEQIASNYLLANTPNAVVLPFPRYACFEPHLQFDEHAFLHFLGAYRYDRGVYKRLAAEFIASYDRLHAAGVSSGTS